MIDQTLAFLAAELENSLGGLFAQHEKHVIVASMSSPEDGARPDANKIVLSLVNLERESAAPAGGGHGRAAPPLYLNLHVLVAVTFSDYTQALGLLGEVLRFFQGRPEFTPRSAAGMPPELDKLNVEFMGMDLAALNNLWSMLGTKYMPSALYKVRMLSIERNRMGEPVPVVRAVDGEARA
jgi:hypothetical protein